MERVSPMERDVIVWLSEVGVRDADGDTDISSLNLTWILHRFEESNGRQLHVTDLGTAATVRTVAELFDRVAKGGDG